MKLLPSVLAAAVFAIVWCGDSKDYYYPKHDAARKTAYEACKEHEKCDQNNNDFTLGACYSFCFLDMNGNDKIVEAEALQVLKLMGAGKPVTHSLCQSEFTKATQKKMSAALVGKLCFVSENLAKGKKGVVTEEDVKGFMTQATANGTQTLNLDRYVMMMEAMRAKGENITL